jgi:DNA-binding transcriptional MocR family regulator
LNFADASPEQLKQWETELLNEYSSIQAKGLNLDLTRGKPSTEQLDLSDALDGILDGNYKDSNGVDARNYGGHEGTAGARKIGTWILGSPFENTIAGGNASLTFMHQTLSCALFDGFNGPDSAWKHIDNPKVICPVPGYDRHYSVCQHLGLEMITVGMTPDGPDMDAVEKLVSEDKSIVAIWNVPRFSNPVGIVYSDDVVKRFAKLGKIANPNFLILWDNAYGVHALEDDAPKLANIWELCRAEGTEDSVIQFASTSKITFAGAGVSFMAASDRNLKNFIGSMANITIGPDKVNQLRLERFFDSEQTLLDHMAKHAAIIKPRFKIVLEHLDQAFADNDLGSWENPEGGYFISFDSQPGLAKSIVKLCADAGVKLTPAGATFPYKNDPQDSNIRIAPTVPSVADLDQAMQVFTCCVKLASVQQAIQS